MASVARGFSFFSLPKLKHPEISALDSREAGKLTANDRENQGLPQARSKRGKREQVRKACTFWKRGDVRWKMASVRSHCSGPSRSLGLRLRAPAFNLLPPQARGATMRAGLADTFQMIAKADAPEVRFWR
jgi:hypothetical protein